MNLKKKTFLITGGTGSLGHMFTETILREHDPEKLIIFSRDELKQYEMRRRFNNDPRLRFFLGDVRDKERLYRAFQGVDIVIHAAALKQVPALEYNPFEAVRTNIIGAYNVVSAACDQKIERVIALSTDKAANPTNLYGATKLCSDKIIISGNNFGQGHTKLSVVRYGNVAGSRGSVLPLFFEQKKTGKLTITDPQMTRFWISLSQAVGFIIHSLDVMVGGEIFVPKIPSIRICDLGTAVAPNCEQIVTGMRPGEKLHEEMIPIEVARSTIEFEKYFVICPEFHEWSNDYFIQNKNEVGKTCDANFSYRSDTNDWWLSVRDLKKIYEDKESAHKFETDSHTLWQATDL